MSDKATTDTLKAILLMTLSMASFATADMFIKLTSVELPASQILTALGVGGTLLFGVICTAKGLPLITSRITHPAVLFRGVSEIIATCGFLMALTLLPFSTASSILQVLPLLVTLGAVLFLGEKVNWRRWSAITIGFFGVLIILNPFASGSDQPSLLSFGAILALVGIVGLAGRDLSTRFIPKDVDNLQAATWGFVTVIIAGGILSLFGAPWAVPGGKASLQLMAMIGFGGIGYFAITAAMRIGDVSAVAPFRYTRIVFAFILSMVIFGETLSARTLIGATLIVAAGIYVWVRERKHPRTPSP